MTSNDRIAWELADLVTEAGEFERPLAPKGWSAPSIVLADDKEGVLVWGHKMDPYTPPTPVDVRPGMLNGFIQLADASGDAIARYAQEWGILGICEHDLPCSHNPPPEPRSEGRVLEGCRPLRLGDEPNLWWEPLETWRQFARKARAILNLTAAIHQGKSGDPDDWHIAHDWTARGNWLPATEGAKRFVIEDALNIWLLLGRVRPVVDWIEQPTPSVTLGGSGLFGALATQLMLTVSRSEGLAFCSSCGNAYVPKRRPRKDQRCYCDLCRAAGASKRDAERDRRRKKDLGK